MRNSGRDNSMRQSSSRAGSPSRTRLLNTLAQVRLLSQGDTYGLGNLFLVMVNSPSKASERYRATQATKLTEPQRDGASEPLSHGVTEATDAIHETAPATRVESLPDAARLSLPFGNNAEALFFYARALKAFEVTTGCSVADELENALSVWWGIAKPASDADFDDYLGALVRAYLRARVPLGANAIQQAMDRAPALSYTPTTAERIERLKSVCRYLQSLAGDSPFFISIRDIATVMQVESLRKAQNALALLIHKHFLTIEEKGTAKGRKATRFRIVKP